MSIIKILKFIMLKNKKQSGFTLIELIVVVAIIGILSTIVIAFLGNARAKSKDNAVKSELNQVRTQAELYYATGSTYEGVCDIASDDLVPKGINGMILSAGKINGYNTPVNVENQVAPRPVACNDVANLWAAQVPLKNETGYYCVDYTRKGIVTTYSIVDYQGNPAAFCR